MRPLCRHCSRSAVHRPRGLCVRCYYAPGVRALYPSTSRYAKRGVGQTGRTLPEPTTAMPGSPEKVAAMEQRAASRQMIFHPDDG